MLIDEHNLLIFKMIHDDESVAVPEGYKLVFQETNGTIQFVSKKTKGNGQFGKYYLVNSSKRWYRILWGTRSMSTSIKAHGEITVMIINNLRFVHKLHKPMFNVKDLQLFISDQMTIYLDEKIDGSFGINEVLSDLNEEFESYGIEVSLIDFYKGVN